MKIVRKGEGAQDRKGSCALAIMLGLSSTTYLLANLQNMSRTYWHLRYPCLPLDYPSLSLPADPQHLLVTARISSGKLSE